MPLTRRESRAPTPDIEVARLIRRVRGLKVILDRDLAYLYQVEVKVLNQAVKRNENRFPADFMFRLSASPVPLPPRSRCARS